MLKIKKWTKEFAFANIIYAMDSAATQYLLFNNDLPTYDSCEKAFNKIYAILKVNRDAEKDPDLKDLFYIRATIRNRFNNNYDPELTLDWLRAARSWGATFEELKAIARSTRNWTSFSEDIDRVIEKYKNANIEDDGLPF